MNWWILKRKVHISWLITLWCFGILFGVFLAQYIHEAIWSSMLVLIAALVATSVAFSRRYIYLIPIIVLSGLLVGLWRGTLVAIDNGQFNDLYGRTILIEGYVKDDVDIDVSGKIIVRLGDLIINKNMLSGVIWVKTENVDVKRGDKLIVSGIFRQGFGGFVGVINDAKVESIIHPMPGDVARVMRDWFADLIRLSIPEPESSLGIGYLVGQRRSLPADLATALQLAGLTHIVVASGYNLTILVRLARRLFSRVSKYLSALSAGVMIVAFIAITGLSPSMSRAGLVSGLALAAWYYGRKFHPIVLLMLAMSITVVINPSYAWGDLGWQLSFAAFAGVMVLAPLISKYLFGDHKLGFIQQILVETVSAQITTAPILIVAFGQLSNVALMANLLILPLVPLAMLLTFISGIGAALLPSLAMVIGLPATWLLGYMISVAEYFAELPWAVSVMEVKVWWSIAMYAVIMAAGFYMWRLTKYNLRDSNIVD